MREKISSLVISYVDENDDFLDAMEEMLKDINECLQSMDFNGFVMMDEVIDIRDKLNELVPINVKSN